MPIERNLHISLEEFFFSHVTWILPFFEKPTEPFSHSAFHFTRTFYQPSKKSPNRTNFFFHVSRPPAPVAFSLGINPPLLLLTPAWEVRTHAVVFRSQNYFAREGEFSLNSLCTISVERCRCDVTMVGGRLLSGGLAICFRSSFRGKRKFGQTPKTLGKEKGYVLHLGVSPFLHRPVPQGSLSLFFFRGVWDGGEIKVPFTQSEVGCLLKAPLSWRWGGNVK